MKKATKSLPTGPAGWAVCITSGKGVVELAVTGPQNGHYPGDWMTPEQAEEIALELVRKAQEARDKKVEETVVLQKVEKVVLHEAS